VTQQVDVFGLYTEDEVKKIKDSVQKSLETAKVFAAKAMTDNEQYNKLAREHNGNRETPNFWISNVFDCTEYARITIAVLQRAISDSRLQVDYISGRNMAMQLALELDNQREQAESHAMVMLRIQEQYMIYDPQTDASTGWNSGNESDALRAAARLYSDNYSDIQATEDSEMRDTVTSLIEFKKVDYSTYTATPMDSEAYRLFLDSVKAGNGNPSVYPPIPNTPTFNPNAKKK
jgi:hypothetical protein